MERMNMNDYLTSPTALPPAVTANMASKTSFMVLLVFISSSDQNLVNVKFERLLVAYKKWSLQCYNIN